MNKFKNIKYGIIPSTNNKLVEVAVTYDVNGTFQRYFIFLRKIEGWPDKAYLDAAKKRFETDVKAGKVKTNKGKPHANKGLVIATSILAVTTLGLGAFLGYEYFTGKLGGGTYQPGQQVDVKPVFEDPSGGNYNVTLTNNEAKVGEKYHTAINLAPKNDTNDEYVLPDKLVSVISNTKALSDKQYTYTRGDNKTTATLDIEGEFVYGPVAVSLVLVSTSEPGPGPGPGPQPGPISWETITEEEASKIRFDVISYQTVRSPLKVLEETVGGTQFKITNIHEMLFPNLSPNEGASHNVTYIDSANMYIEEDDQDETDDDEFCTYHINETNPESTGVYNCFYGDENDRPKENKLLYPSASIEQAVEKFLPSMGEYTVESWANDIYGNEEMLLGENTAFVVLDNYYYDLQERFYVPKEELPEITFEKGNDLSFKLTANKTIHFYLEEAEGYIDVDTNFEFSVENGILTNFVQHMLLSMQEQELFEMNTTRKLETASFTPKDLSEYFAE